MIERPSDRAAAGKELVESLGGAQEAFYWMQGKHDGFLISNVPDGVATAALSAAVGASGADGEGWTAPNRPGGAFRTVTAGRGTAA